MNKGLLIVISGCSGVGKGTIVKYLESLNSDFRVSVSATTRAPREGEVHGKNYFFLTEDEFAEMVGRGEFMEYAVYNGCSYGTPKTPVEKSLEEGCNVILEIDVQGGLQIKELYPDSLSIFIVPPTMQELENRLRSRASETEEAIQSRMKIAENEMALRDRYDRIVLNDVVERAADEIISIVNSEREKRSV